MSSVNTGILINAYPLTAQQIADIEAQVFTSNGSYAFLSDKRELCFAFPWGVDSIKELAWHQAWELSIEDSLYVKRIYKKKSQREYYLWKTLYKKSLDEPWPSDEPQLDPAVISLDGDLLSIFDASGLATSATIFVNGEPMKVVDFSGSTEETLDPKYNHYGIVPEGYSYMSYVTEGASEGEPFPPINEADDYQGPDNLMYRYSNGEWRVDESSPSVSPNADGSVVVLESINGAPVTTICGFGHGGLPMFNGDAITTIVIPKSIVKIDEYAFAGATSLTQITYLGTMEQWSAIELVDGWNQNCPAFTVSCTDGPIAIPAYGS